MPIVAALPAIAGIAGAGASIFGAVNAGNAAKDAAQAQQQASQAAIAEQQRQFNVGQQNLQPFLNGGQQALNAQLALLGLAPAQTSGQMSAANPGASQAPNWSAYVQNNPDVLAAYDNGNGHGASMDDFGQWHWNTFGQNEANAGNPNRTYTPYGPAQGQAGAQAQPGSTAGDPAAIQAAAIAQLKNGPVYQSLYHNGEQAVLANAAATGGLRGGNANRSLYNLGNDTLSQVFQQQVQNLGSVAGQGQSAGTNLSQLGANTANQQGNLILQGGAAQAGGILGQANANNLLAKNLAGLPTALGGLFGGAKPTVGGASQAIDPSALAGLF